MLYCRVGNINNFCICVSDFCNFRFRFIYFNIGNILRIIVITITITRRLLSTGIIRAVTLFTFILTLLIAIIVRIKFNFVDLVSYGINAKLAFFLFLLFFDCKNSSILKLVKLQRNIGLCDSLNCNIFY